MTDINDFFLTKFLKGFLISVFEYCHYVKSTYHQRLETKNKNLKNQIKNEFLVTLL